MSPSHHLFSCHWMRRCANEFRSALYSPAQRAGASAGARGPSPLRGDQVACSVPVSLKGRVPCRCALPDFPRNFGNRGERSHHQKQLKTIKQSPKKAQSLPHTTAQSLPPDLSRSHRTRRRHHTRFRQSTHLRVASLARRFTGTSLHLRFASLASQPRPGDSHVPVTPSSSAARHLPSDLAETATGPLLVTEPVRIQLDPSRTR